MHVASRLLSMFFMFSVLPTLNAQAAEISVDLEWRSRYVFDPATVVVDRPVGVVNLHLNWESGWYVNTWHAAEVGNVMVEGDYTVGYLWTVLDDSWSIDLSLSYYDVNRIGSFGDGDLLVPIGHIAYVLPDGFVPFGGTVTVQGTFEWYSYLGDLTDLGYEASDGFITYGGVEGDWPLFPGVNLTVGADYGYATIDGYDGEFQKVRCGMTWTITDQTGIQLSYDHRFGSMAESEGVWTVGVSHTF